MKKNFYTIFIEVECTVYNTFYAGRMGEEGVGNGLCSYLFIFILIGVSVNLTRASRRCTEPFSAKGISSGIKLLGGKNVDEPCIVCKLYSF